MYLSLIPPLKFSRGCSPAINLTPMKLRSIKSNNGRAIDYDKDYESLSAANQLIAGIAETLKVNITVSEYEGRLYITSASIADVHAALLAAK